MTPEDMIGHNFLDQPRYDEERHRATILKAISNHDKELESNTECIKFLYSFNDDQYEKMYAYNDILRNIDKDNNNPDIWTFKHKTAHTGTLERNHPNYKGCPYDAMIEWQTG